MRIPFLLVGMLAAWCVPAFAMAALSAPANLTITGSKYTNDRTPTFTWTTVPGATRYDYKLNNNDYLGLHNVTSFTTRELQDGWYTFAVRAHNATDSSAAASFTFEIDTAGPAIPEVTPGTATVGKATMFATTPSGDAWTSGCSMTVDGATAGDMTRKGDAFRRAHTFTTAGKHRIVVTCTDGDGNTSTSRSTTITVAASAVAQAGDVIKTAESSAIYYYGGDGMRHAFPTEAVFRTWYDDFAAVKTVSASFMEALPLGKNVTVRPGALLVQFASSPRVYAVGVGRRLRHYVNEDVVTLDYGANWRTLLLTLPDWLRSNYEAGAKIDAAADYDPSATWDRIRSIEDVLN